MITVGNVGGAVIPLLFGWAADKLGFSLAFIVPILCYLRNFRVQAAAENGVA